MSYLEYRVKTVPTGWRKVLFINWGLIVLIIGAAFSGFVMLISVAGGSLDPWASAQIQRFSIGLLAMFIICLLYTSPSPRDMRRSRMPSSA